MLCKQQKLQSSVDFFSLLVFARLLHSHINLCEIVFVLYKSRHVLCLLPSGLIVLNKSGNIILAFNVSSILELLHCIREGG